MLPIALIQLLETKINLSLISNNYASAPPKRANNCYKQTLRDLKRSYEYSDCKPGEEIPELVRKLEPEELYKNSYNGVVNQTFLEQKTCQFYNDYKPHVEKAFIKWASWMSTRGVGMLSQGGQTVDITTGHRVAANIAFNNYRLTLHKTYGKIEDNIANWLWCGFDLMNKDHVKLCSLQTTANVSSKKTKKYYYNQNKKYYDELIDPIMEEEVGSNNFCMSSTYEEKEEDKVFMQEVIVKQERFRELICTLDCTIKHGERGKGNDAARSIYETNMWWKLIIEILEKLASLLSDIFTAIPLNNIQKQARLQKMANLVIKAAEKMGFNLDHAKWNLAQQPDAHGLIYFILLNLCWDSIKHEIEHFEKEDLENIFEIFSWMFRNKRVRMPPKGIALHNSYGAVDHQNMEEAKKILETKDNSEMKELIDTLYPNYLRDDDSLKFGVGMGMGMANKSSSAAKLIMSLADQEMLASDDAVVVESGFIQDIKGKPDKDYLLSAACVRMALGDMFSRACGANLSRDKCIGIEGGKSLEYNSIYVHRGERVINFNQAVSILQPNGMNPLTDYSEMFLNIQHAINENGLPLSTSLIMIGIAHQNYQKCYNCIPSSSTSMNTRSRFLYEMIKEGKLPPDPRKRHPFHGGKCPITVTSMGLDPIDLCIHRPIAQYPMWYFERIANINNPFALGDVRTFVKFGPKGSKQNVESAVKLSPMAPQVASNRTATTNARGKTRLKISREYNSLVKDLSEVCPEVALGVESNLTLSDYASESFCFQLNNHLLKHEITKDQANTLLEMSGIPRDFYSRYI